jgi:hypothetical protein
MLPRIDVRLWDDVMTIAGDVKGTLASLGGELEPFLKTPEQLQHGGTEEEDQQ